MEVEKRNGKRPGGTARFLRALAFVLLFAFLCALPVASWLFVSRIAGAVTPISDPTALFINAANQEDLRYLQLSGIDVSEGTYKDFVFCVRGNNVNRYLLQLAYTTNNQFTFEIYRATLSTGSVPQSALGVVEYTPHDGSSDQLYYIPDASSRIDGHFLNNRTGSDKLAKDDDDFHDATYGGYSSVDRFAEPLYWHSDSSILVPDEDKDAMENFFHYFIIRVIWSEGKTNDKETDIIFISAKNTSS